MATSGDLQKKVERILQKNNVELKDFMMGDLSRIAGHFLAEGFIEDTTVDSMNVTGVAPFLLASRLMRACQPSLVQTPEKNFPRFIAVLKKYETMVPLAEKMENEFKEASMS